jgi:hypothetical protein
MNSGDSGSFNHLRYDQCAYEEDINQSMSPLTYRTFNGQFENCNKCVYNKDSFYHPYDNVIVDTESELKGINRRYTRCSKNKYSPTCKKSQVCTSTFDNSVPVVMAQEVCPIVRNNIPRINGSGCGNWRFGNEPLCPK